MYTQPFKESDIEFTFGSDWIVKKYDNHAYFKILSGHGLKGVDFIGIYKNEGLYLIEVKNYYKRSYSPVEPDLSDVEGTHPLLGSALHSKIEDSLRLIKIVNKYLETRWWFKIAYFWRNTLSRKVIKKDWHFWTRVGELSENAQKVFPVLWLEMDSALIEQSNQSTSTVSVSLKSEYDKRKQLPTQVLQIISTKNYIRNKVLEGVRVIRKE